MFCFCSFDKAEDTQAYISFLAFKSRQISLWTSCDQTDVGLLKYVQIETKTAALITIARIGSCVQAKYVDKERNKLKNTIGYQPYEVRYTKGKRVTVPRTSYFASRNYNNISHVAKFHSSYQTYYLSK